MQVKISASPSRGVREIPKPVTKRPVKPSKETSQTAELYPSTLLTSPLSGRSRIQKLRSGVEDAEEEEEEGLDYTRNDFVVSDNAEEFEADAFEPVRHVRGSRRRDPNGRLGPPISVDREMDFLPDIHRHIVEQFVDEAKKREEQLRNNKGLTKPLFTESDFRRMAIRWTLTLPHMREIPGINQERVDTFGPKFLGMIKGYHANYNEMMNNNPNRDGDRNHDIVIVVSSSDEGDRSLEEGDDEADENDDEDENEDDATSTVEGSKYFVRDTNSSTAQVTAEPSRGVPRASGRV